MTNRFKKIVSFVLACLFAVSPILFTGCDFDPNDLNGGNTGGNTGGDNTGGNTGGGDDNQGDKTTSNYKVSDYLSAVKVSYALNGSSDTQDEDIKQFAKDALDISQMMAQDVITQLVQQYSTDTDSTGKSISRGDMSKSFGAVKTPLNQTFSDYYPNGDQTQKDDEQAKINSYYYNGRNSNDSFEGATKKWKMYIEQNVNNISPSNLDMYLQFFDYNKISYAILLISSTFGSVTQSTYSQAYSTFKQTYQQNISGKDSIDIQNMANELSFSVTHTALSGEWEKQAFKQYIQDFVVGETEISADNGKYAQIQTTYFGLNINYSPTEEFEGEVWHYVEESDSDYRKDDTDSYDISYYYYHGNMATGDNNIGTFTDKLLKIYADIGIKMWQDIDNNGVPDVAMTDFNGVGVPKFVAFKGFKNYKYTISAIVDSVTSASNLIKYTGEQQPSNSIIINDILYLKGYPIVTNALMVDYAYSEVEIAMDSMTGSSASKTYSSKLGMRNYQSVILCLKDRSGQDIKNNLGTIELIIESKTGDQVSMDIYARYYRKNSSTNCYATWNDNTYYKLTNQTMIISGPAGIDTSSGQIVESGSITLNFNDFDDDSKNMFKTAVFNGEYNQNYFDYTYKDILDNDKTVQIYEIKQFPENFYDTTPNIEQRVKHSSVFAKASVDNQLYQSVYVDNTQVYSYIPENLDEQDEFEYIEILFANHTTNQFTFGFSSYTPATEDHV